MEMVIKHGIEKEIYSIQGFTVEARLMGHLVWVTVDLSKDGYHHKQSQLHITKAALEYLENNDGE